MLDLEFVPDGSDTILESAAVVNGGARINFSFSLTFDFALDKTEQMCYLNHGTVIGVPPVAQEND